MVRFLSIGVTVLIAIVMVVMASIIYIKHLYEGDYNATEQKIVIPVNSSTKKIANILYKKNIIPYAISKTLPYILYVNGRDRQLKAGEFLIEKSMSPKAVIDRIISGENVKYKITFPEGETVFMALDRILKSEKLSGSIMIEPKEGTLEPNTYIFTQGMKRDLLIKQMLQAQENILTKAWERRPKDLPLKNKYELLILASLIEKESAVGSEGPLIASVFINRLRKGMKLQTDPTIIYGITKGKRILGRPIYRSDIQDNTAYNTYHIKGLPPTPICNPGKASIEAIIYAKDTEYLYFVADGTGGHHFSKSLDEHNIHVKKLRQREKEQKKIK